MAMDAVHAYRAATENTPNLIAAVRRIETDVLRKMRDEGYGINQLRTALSESRYPLFAAQKSAVNDYLESILPDGASAATNFSLPAPPARFNMLYESRMCVRRISAAASMAYSQGIRRHAPRSSTASGVRIVRQCGMRQSARRQKCSPPLTASGQANGKTRLRHWPRRTPS